MSLAFHTFDVDLSCNYKASAQATYTYDFQNTVTNAEAAIRGWSIASTSHHYVTEMEFQITDVRIEGTVVSVVVKAWWTDKDHNSVTSVTVSGTVLMIADLET